MGEGKGAITHYKQIKDHQDHDWKGVSRNQVPGETTFGVAGGSSLGGLCPQWGKRTNHMDYGQQKNRPNPPQKKTKNQGVQFGKEPAMQEHGTCTTLKEKGRETTCETN